MSKGKLEKFAEVEGFKHVVQPKLEEVFRKDYFLKGKWNSDFFQNNGPITLELGCGKGEYTVGLAKMYPDRNFLGVDIKGARIWKGAKQSHEEGLKNVGFLRTRIDFINSFFTQDEVDEIWFTFPDPQLKKPLKRLTSSRFLNYYSQFLRPGGWINLKTDSEVLFHYTKKLAEFNKLEIAVASEDIYGSGIADEILSIRTFYEKTWLEQGLRSHYIRFRLNNNQPVTELPDEE
ncbi:MAG: tRNA (guanosine(46)-N7)-methyltransferase TrmB [Bacteroidales bacterium]|nr:tRNA (guanosine(46)-N7)-methyltransferase TrmB [Bacteroidales bacterium]